MKTVKPTTAIALSIRNKDLLGVTQYNPAMRKVLRKLCAVVKVDPNAVKFNSDDWYREHTWTQAQEQRFVAWMANYLYTDTKARREISTVWTKDKKRCQDAAREFALWYGWKSEPKAGA